MCRKYDLIYCLSCGLLWMSVVLEVSDLGSVALLVFLESMYYIMLSTIVRGFGLIHLAYLGERDTVEMYLGVDWSE